MDWSKYIVIESEFGVESPVIFSCMLKHSEVAGQRKVIAAGFCDIGITDERFDVTVWGESTSLGGIKSRGEIDVKMIRRYVLRLDE